MRQTFYCSFFVSVIVLALCGIPTGVPAQWSAVAPNLFPYWQPYSFGCMVFKDGTLCIGNQYVIVSQDSGITWTNSNLTPPLLTSALTNAVSEITFYDRTNGALVTEDAQVYVTNDAGANWKQVLLLDTSYSRAISFMGSPRDIMVGTRDEVPVHYFGFWSDVEQIEFPDELVPRVIRNFEHERDRAW
jgi:hypothetical protein